MERSTLGSQLQGHPKVYRLTFVYGSTNVFTAVYDQMGREESETASAAWDGRFDFNRIKEPN